jgi:hypothetical protein
VRQLDAALDYLGILLLLNPNNPKRHLLRASTKQTQKKATPR